MLNINERGVLYFLTLERRERGKKSSIISKHLYSFQLPKYKIFCMLDRRGCRVLLVAQIIQITKKKSQDPILLRSFYKAALKNKCILGEHVH